MGTITAEVVLDYLIPNAKELMSVTQWENAINAINGHTRQYVKIALKEASEKATIKRIMYEDDIIDKESILNAYSLKNIK